MKQAIVKIQRGRYSHYFQVTRAWLTAASALVTEDRLEAISFINNAILELTHLRRALERIAEPTQEGH
jgi:hypothetical protein